MAHPPRSAHDRSPVTSGESFRYVHRITADRAGNFYPAFLLLPRRKRRATEALYAFFRVADDIADGDDEPSKRAERLRAWRLRLHRTLNDSTLADPTAEGFADHPVFPAVRQSVRQFGIPQTYFDDVLDGLETDLQPARFATLADSEVYCYRVASAVGLACLYVWGFRDSSEARAAADMLGRAFQWTNIVRDLKEDYAAGRVYLPTEDLRRFHCPPESWNADSLPFQELVRFEIRRALTWFDDARRLLRHLSFDGRMVVGALSAVYRGLAEKIEHDPAAVWRTRVRLGRTSKVARLSRGAFRAVLPFRNTSYRTNR